MCGGERAKSAAPLRGISSRVFQDLPKGVAEKSAGAIAAAATATAVMNDGMSGERCRSELAVHVTVVSELVFFFVFFLHVPHGAGNRVKPSGQLQVAKVKMIL